MRRKHRGLSLETEYRAVYIRLPRKNADVVGQITRRKIIRPVNHHIISRHKFRRVFAGETALMQFDLDLRIDIAQTIPSRFEFASADVICSVEDLPLEIRKVDIVEIDNSNHADAGRSEVERRW